MRCLVSPTFFKREKREMPSTSPKKKEKRRLLIFLYLYTGKKEGRRGRGSWVFLGKEHDQSPLLLFRSRMSHKVVEQRGKKEKKGEKAKSRPLSTPTTEIMNIYRFREKGGGRPQKVERPPCGK